MSSEIRLKAIEEQMAQLKAEAKALKPKPEPTLTFKVHEEKGTISVYGLQKYPVTLYPSQWVKLFKVMPELMKIAQPLHDARIAAEAAKTAEVKTA